MSSFAFSSRRNTSPRRGSSANNNGDPDAFTALAPAALREQAMRLLARRDHTRADLARKLAAGAESPEALDQLLDDLVALGLLSDQRYADQRSTVRGKSLGNSRVANELRTKGVEDAIIATALDALGDEMSRARDVWQKKFRGVTPGSREEWAKHARFLQSRGFPPNLIRKLLNDPNHGSSDSDEE